MKKLLTPPSFEDDDKTRNAYLLHWCLIGFIPLTFTFIFIFTVLYGTFVEPRVFTLVLLFLFLLGIFFLVRRGFIWLASWGLITSMWAVFTAAFFVVGGVRLPAVSIFVVIVLLGALLLGSWQGLLIMIACITTLLGLNLAEEAGLIIYVSENVSALGAIVIQVFALSFTFIITKLYTSQLTQAVNKSRESERRYRDSEQQYSRLFNGVPIGLYRTTLEGQIADINPALIEMLGYPDKETLIEKDVNDLYVNPDDRDHLIDTLNKDGISRNFTTQFYRYDEDTIWAENHATLVRKEDGKITLEGGLIDITERKRVDQKLKESENLYKTLFNSASDAIFVLEVTNEGAYFSTCNPRTLEIFGGKPKDIIGKSPAELSPELQPDGRSSDERVRKIAEAAIAGKPQFFEWRHCRLDGVHFDAEVAVNRIEIGDKPGLLAIVRDITERINAEEELKNYQEHLGELVKERTRELEISTKKLQLITDSMPALIAYINTDYRYEFANAYYQELLHVEPSKVIGRTVKDIIGEEGFSAVKSRYDGAFRGERQEYETTFTLPHGRVGTFLAVYVPNELDGKIDGCFALVQDITQRKKTEEQKAVFEERQRLARDLHDSVTQYLYSLTFLAKAIKNYVEMKNWDQVHANMEKVQNTSLQALKEMRLLVYELLPASFEEQGLMEIIRQRLNAVEQRAGVEVELYAEGDFVVPVSDQYHLFQIIQEALNNSLKHAHASRVTIKILTTREKIELYVDDNGQGFDTEQSSEGMGLGNMQERANKLGGHLSISSNPERGTRVSFLRGKE